MHQDVILASDDDDTNAHQGMQSSLPNFMSDMHAHVHGATINEHDHYISVGWPPMQPGINIKQRERILARRRFKTEKWRSIGCGQHVSTSLIAVFVANHPDAMLSFFSPICSDCAGRQQTIPTAG